MLERNDAIVARMTRSVTSLEASLTESRDQLAENERTLATKIKEVELKTAECRQTQQLLDERTEQVRQLQTSLVRVEEALSERQRDLDQRSRRITELEADNTHLRTNLMAVSAQLEETALQLDGTRADKKRLQCELERTLQTTEELRQELEASREQMRRCEDERQRLAAGVSQLNDRNCRTVLKQLVSVTRHNTTVPPAALVVATSTPPAVSARKLFDVQVKHERSSTSRTSPSVMHRDVTDSQHYSPAPSRQVFNCSDLLGRPTIVGITYVLCLT